jgi:hypothetical protein
MNGNILVQYVGFETKGLMREYTFSVREREGLREFTIGIASEAFNLHHARYQDAPDICSLKLQRELAAGANHPTESHFCLSDAELDEYHAAHLIKSRLGRSLRAAKNGRIF